MSEVLDAFDTQIYFAAKESKEFKTSDSNFTIDNTGNGKVLPVFKFETDDEFTISEGTDFIENNFGYKFSLGDDLTVSSGETLVLDFHDQEYYLAVGDYRDYLIEDYQYGINFTKGLFNLPENKEVEITIDVDGDFDLTVECKQYGEELRGSYKRDYNQTLNNTTREYKPFNSKNMVDKEITEEEIDFTFNQLTTGYELYDKLNQSDEWRIRYEEDNRDNNYKQETILIGCTLDGFRKSFNEGDFIISNITGTARKQIKL